MEKKKYTKPAAIMVKLSHEQAVIGTCSSDSTSLKDSSPTHGCAAAGCKAKTIGAINSGPSS